MLHGKKNILMDENPVLRLLRKVFLDFCRRGLGSLRSLISFVLTSVLFSCEILTISKKITMMQK
jgi:hypothetical protein